MADILRFALAIVLSLVMCAFALGEVASEKWPKLPETNAAVEIPAQDWPARSGPRKARVSIYYPRGKLSNVGAKTGLMLTLHNWGGEDCVGTASPQALADRLNVVAICVNYLQSGAKDSIEGPEPYDFGYLQALDALRALWWVRDQLNGQNHAFDDHRIFATGGSGGGNVALMANKLAPRTFTCVVDLCGMKKLSADIAFNQPGGSDLDARWSRDPKSPAWLSSDAQDLRFVGHPAHLRTMKQLRTEAKVIVVHGVDDTTCPFADAKELVTAMRKAKIDVEPHFIDQAQVDGRVFGSTGHNLGNRTEIVFKTAGDYLAEEGEKSLRRREPTDFERRDEQVRYRTSGGEYVISYKDGFPAGRFEANPPVISYPDHNDLLSFRDAQGERHEVRTLDDWQTRRRHIVENWQRAAGDMPSESFRVPLDVKVLEESHSHSITRRKITFQSDPFDRVSAWLLIPDQAKRSAAMLCLHQTTRRGKDETVGLAGREHMHYGLELANRGYVVLAPDYPSFADHLYDFAANPEFASGSLKAVWDNRRAIDLLASLDEVDPERIGVIGHSLGGHNAMFTALVEPRLKVIVSSCGFTSMQRDDVPSWSGAAYMPRIANKFANDAKRLPFDFAELVAALAPRPFLACAAEGDTDFDVHGVREVLDVARAVYKLHAADDALQGEYPAGPHEFPPAARKRAYEFLDQHLRGTEPGTSKK